MSADFLDLRKIELRAVRIDNDGFNRRIGGGLRQAAGHIQQGQRTAGARGEIE